MPECTRPHIRRRMNSTKQSSMHTHTYISGPEDHVLYIYVCRHTWLRPTWARPCIHVPPYTNVPAVYVYMYMHTWPWPCAANMYVLPVHPCVRVHLPENTWMHKTLEHAHAYILVRSKKDHVWCITMRVHSRLPPTWARPCIHVPPYIIMSAVHVYICVQTWPWSCAPDRYISLVHTCSHTHSLTHTPAEGVPPILCPLSSIQPPDPPDEPYDIFYVYSRNFKEFPKEPFP